MALAELRAEAFEQPYLLIREFDLALGSGLFQPQQALVTGLDADLLASGAAICDLRKSFNVACGWRREEDTLPGRLLTGKLSRERLDAMVAGYYRARGWSAAGVPPARVAP